MGCLSLYNGNKPPYDIDAEKFKALKETMFSLKPQAAGFYTIADIFSSFTNGQAHLIPGIGEWITLGLRASGKPLDTMIPKEGGIQWTESLSIVKGTPKKDLARKFIQYTASPIGQVKQATKPGQQEEHPLHGRLEIAQRDHAEGSGNAPHDFTAPNVMDEYKAGKIAYRQLPKQQSIEEWNEAWGEFKSPEEQSPCPPKPSQPGNPKRRPSTALLPGGSRAARAGASPAPIILGLPVLVWQTIFFLLPLLFLLVITFWKVANFRLSRPLCSTTGKRSSRPAPYLPRARTHDRGFSLTTVLGLLISLPVARTIAFRLSPRHRDLAIALLIIPIFSSYILRVYAWQIVLSPQGIINSLTGLIGFPPLPLLGGGFALQIGLLTLTLPLAILILVFALAGLDRTWLEAAQNMGCGRWQIFRHVVLPAIRPALFLAGTTIFLIAFGDYVSPVFLTGSKPPTLSILIVDTVKSGSQWPRALGDRRGDARDPRPRLHLRAACRALARPEGRRSMIVRGASSRLSAALQTALLLAVFVFLATPILAIIVFSFDANRYPSIPWGGFSFTWYEAILTDDLVTRAAWNSVFVGFGTAIAATFIGFAAAYIDYRYSFRGKRGFVLLVAIPPAVPVTILGMAMLGFLRASDFRAATSRSSSATRRSRPPSPWRSSACACRISAGDRACRVECRGIAAKAIVFVIIPFCRSAAIAAAFLLSAAYPSDEFMIAWFVGGTNETIPVRVLNMLLGQVSPKINAIGTIVLLVSFILVLSAQVSSA